MPEEPEYLSLKEAAEYLGIKRASIYYYIKALNVKPEKFEHNKNAYLPIEVVKRMKKIKEQPWKAKEVKREQLPPPQPIEHQIKPVKQPTVLPEEPRVSDSAQSRIVDIPTQGWNY